MSSAISTPQPPSCVLASTSPNDAGDVELAAGLKVTLAVVIGRLGDLDGALVLLDAAEPQLRGAEQARAIAEPGDGPYWRGEFADAAADAGVGLPSAEASR